MVMEISREPERVNIKINDEDIEKVTNFTYLSVVT